MAGHEEAHRERWSVWFLSSVPRNVDVELQSDLKREEECRNRAAIGIVRALKSFGDERLEVSGVGSTPLSTTEPR